MKLIKDLRARLIKNKWIHYAIFWCIVCEQEVEKQLYAGMIAKSCGFLNCKDNKRNYKHGESETKLYIVWKNMDQRCNNPSNKAYGGKGIIVCPKWLDIDNGFVNFKNWALANGYRAGLAIDRINNNGNYEPTNCQWITQKENNRKQLQVKLTQKIANEIRELYKTGNYTQKELAKKYNISQYIISKIVNNKLWV